MKKRISIIGSGVARLHLAYALKDAFGITVIERQTPEKLKAERIMSTKVHFGPTRTREERLQLLKWDNQPLLESIHITLGDKKLFKGNLTETALSVDQRILSFY